MSLVALTSVSSKRKCRHISWGRHFLLSTYGSTGLRGRGDQAVARQLSIHRTTQHQNKRTQTSMPEVSFEPTIPPFERVKTVHALDRAAIVIVCPKLDVSLYELF
jgi:hypothetical protein